MAEIQPGDWLQAIVSFVSIVVGLIIAGQLSPWLADRKARRDQREYLIRVMLRTMPMPAHQDFQSALSQIQFDFRGHSEVMAALKTWLDASNVADDLSIDLPALTAELISAMFRAVGLAVSPGEILSRRYISKAFFDREALALEGSRAWPRIADALEKNNALLERALNQKGPDDPSKDA